MSWPQGNTPKGGRVWFTADKNRPPRGRGLCPMPPRSSSPLLHRQGECVPGRRSAADERVHAVRRSSLSSFTLTAASRRFLSFQTENVRKAALLTLQGWPSIAGTL